jgi:hypothetical protein
MTEEPRMQQWNEGLRLKGAAAPEEGGWHWQDLQEDRKGGDQKANSQVFDWTMGSEWLDIVERSAPPEMKEEMPEA